jgi:hypothetical protein
VAGRTRPGSSSSSSSSSCAVRFNLDETVRRGLGCRLFGTDNVPRASTSTSVLRDPGINTGEMWVSKVTHNDDPLAQIPRFGFGWFGSERELEIGHIASKVETGTENETGDETGVGRYDSRSESNESARTSREQKREGMRSRTGGRRGLQGRARPIKRCGSARKQRRMMAAEGAQR